MVIYRATRMFGWVLLALILGFTVGMITDPHLALEVNELTETGASP